MLKGFLSIIGMDITLLSTFSLFAGKNPSLMEQTTNVSTLYLYSAKIVCTAKKIQNSTTISSFVLCKILLQCSHQIGVRIFSTYVDICFWSLIWKRYVTAADTVPLLCLFTEQYITSRTPMTAVRSGVPLMQRSNYVLKTWTVKVLYVGYLPPPPPTSQVKYMLMLKTSTT